MKDQRQFEPVHIGIIGAGMISRTYLDSLTTKFDILKVDAIADRSGERAAKLAEEYGIRAVTVDQILDDETIEIILNLTPPGAHGEVIEKILNAGKHAYTEKCFALNTEIASRLCKLADEKGLFLGCAPDTFFSGWAQSARHLIDEGVLGTITSFTMMGNRDNERLLSAMDYLNRPGGGIILDYSVYYLTNLINLLGPVRRVSANIKAPYPTHVNQFELSPHFGETFASPNESQFYSILELESGITGTVSINADSVFFDQTYYAIYGNKGIMYLGCPDWFTGQIYIYENTYDFSQAETPKRIRQSNPYGFNQDSRGVGVADMAWAIREGRGVRASKERALHVMDIQECMVKSHENNGSFVNVNSTCERALPLSIPTGRDETSLMTGNNTDQQEARMN